MQHLQDVDVDTNQFKFGNHAEELDCLGPVTTQSASALVAW